MRKQILLALCMGSSILLATGCASTHRATLDGISVDCPFLEVTDHGSSATYTFTDLFGIEDRVVVKTDSGSAVVVQAQRKDIYLKVDGRYTPLLEAKATGHNDAYGAMAMGRSIYFEDPFAVKSISDKQDAFGLYALGRDSRIEFAGGNISVNAGRDGFGIYASGRGSRIEFSGGNVGVFAKENAYGAYVNEAEVNFGANPLQMEVVSDAGNAYGVYASADRDSRITFSGGDAKITAQANGINKSAYGMYGDAGSRISLSGVTAHIASMANAQNGIAYGIYAAKDAYVEFSGAAADIKAEANGEGGKSYGIYNSGGQVTFFSPATITAENHNQPGYGVYTAGGTVEFRNDAQISGNLEALNSGKVNFGSGAHTITGTLTANGGTIGFTGGTNTITGDLRASGNGEIRMAGAENYIKGNLYAEDTARVYIAMSKGALDGMTSIGGSGEIHLDLSTENAGWSSVGSSSLTELGLSNGAVWNNEQGSGNVARFKANRGIINQNSQDSITVKNFDGNLQVNYKSQDGGDKIQVSGGKFVVNAANQGSQITMNTNLNISGFDEAKIKTGLVGLAQKLQYDGINANDPTKTDGKLTAKAAINEGLTTSGVTADITLFPGDADQNAIGSLENTDLSGLPNMARMAAASGQSFTIGNIVYGSRETMTMRGIQSAAAVNLLSWREENVAMARLSDLRRSDDAAGLWAQMYGGQMEYDSSSGFKNKYQIFQVGYDKRVMSGDDAWLFGGAVSYTDGSSDYENGSGENTSTGLSIYGSWLGGKGHFFDLALKESRLDNDYTIYGLGGLKTSGDYDNWGTSISAAYGRRIAMDDNWYFEPQAGLSYGHVNSADYTADNGLRITQDGMDSLVGHAGFSIGRKIGNSGSLHFSAAALHDFDGKTGVRFDAPGEEIKSTSQDFGGTWYALGVGGSYALSDHSNVYADVGRTIGGDVETPWRYNAGIRVSF